MDKAAVLQNISEEIIGLKNSKKPYMVAVDGMCCSGKTTFAAKLASIFSKQGFKAINVSIDDFHRPRKERYRQGEFSAEGYYEDTFDYKAIEKKLLIPVSTPPFACRCYTKSFNLIADEPITPEPIIIDKDALIIFEGLFLFKDVLDKYWDYRILLDIDFKTSIERALVRDKSLIGHEKDIRKKYELRYNPAWQIYQNECNPKQKANVIIDNYILSKV